MNSDQKLAVHELLSQAAYCLDERLLDRLVACFSENAIMSISITGADPIAPFEGREAIRKLMADSMEGQIDKRRHVISNFFFETEGETSATVVSNLSLFSIKDGKIALITTGVYHDEVVKAGGRWQLAVRQLDLDLPY